VGATRPALESSTHVGALAPVAGAIPLSIAWSELPSPAPRALALAYALGRLLHRHAGKPDARLSPTFQIPVAPGSRTDPLRVRRRVVPALASVRFEAGQPEPFEAFAARTADLLAREAGGEVCSRGRSPRRGRSPPRSRGSGGRWGRPRARNGSSRWPA
jgi:hypothetical protein